jgi:hypothetical protein
MKHILGVIFFTAVSFSTTVWGQVQQSGPRQNGNENRRQQVCSTFESAYESANRDLTACRRANPNSTGTQTCLEERDRVDQSRTSLDRCISNQTALRTECRDLEREVKDSRNKTLEACSKSGLKGSKAISCVRSAGECAQTDSSSEWGNVANMALGSIMGSGPMNFGSYNSTCPRRTLADWDKKSDNIERDKKSLMDKSDRIEDELARLDEKKAEKAGDLNDKAQELQENLDKEIADIDKSLQEAEVSTRAKIREMRAKQQTLAATVRINQAAMASKIRIRNAFLKTMTMAILKSNCKVEIEQKYQKYKKDIGKSVIMSNSFNAMGQSGSSDVQLLKIQYQACLDMAIAKKDETIEKFNSEMISLEENIKQAQADQKLMDQEMLEMQSALEKQIEMGDSQKQKATNAAIRKQQALMAKMQELNANIAKQQQQKQTTLRRNQMEMFQISNRLNNLGPEPKGDKLPLDTVTSAESYRAAYEACVDAKAGCNCGNENLDLLGKEINNAGTAYDDRD